MTFGQLAPRHRPQDAVQTGPLSKTNIPAAAVQSRHGQVRRRLCREGSVEVASTCLCLSHVGADAGGAAGQEGRGEALGAGLRPAARLRRGPALGPEALRLRPVPRRRVQGQQRHLCLPMLSTIATRQQSAVLRGVLAREHMINHPTSRICKGSLCSWRHSLWSTEVVAAARVAGNLEHAWTWVPLGMK